ncbi:hypothetical protein Aduo_018964 [Ancylostoma duodenale]
MQSLLSSRGVSSRAVACRACSVVDSFKLHERHIGKDSEEETKIGRIIAEHLVDNGATLQMGIGAVSDVVLKNHKVLGSIRKCTRMACWISSSPVQSLIAKKLSILESCCRLSV